MADQSLSKLSVSSKGRQRRRKGTPSSFPLETQQETSISQRKHSGRHKTSNISQSTYEEELRTLSPNSSSVTSTTAVIGGKRNDVQRRGGGEGSNYYHNDDEDSENGRENESDFGGSRITEQTGFDVSERVNRIYESLNSFNERFRNFDTLTSSRLAATPEHQVSTNSSRPSAASGSAVKMGGKTNNSKTERVAVKPNAKKAEKKRASVRKERDARRDLTRVVPKMFGLDPMAVVGDSVDDDEEHSLSASHNQFQSQSEPLSGSSDRQSSRSKKVERHHKTQPQTIRVSDEVVLDNDYLSSDGDVPNLGPVMPLLSDKKFLHKLQQREGRITKDISDMKNHLDVINTNVEKALRKAQVDADRRKGQNFKVLPKKPSTSTNTPGRVKKPLGNGPNAKEGPSKKLTEFLQATGGQTGGWTHEDHSAFMRTYMKWKDRPVKMLDILTKLLPNKSSQDVMAHVSWYDQYDSLHKTNQAYIRQWRINKRHEQEMIYRMGSEGHKANLEANKRRQEILQATRQEESERSRNRLTQWKRTTIRKTATAGASDDERKLYVDEFVKKNANLSIMNVRKRLEALTIPRNFDIEESPQSQGMSNLKAFSKSIREHTAPSRSISTRSSSGVFTDTNDSNANPRQRPGRVVSMRIGPPRNENDEEEEFDREHLPKINDGFRIGRSNKLLMQFRSRDNKIVQARKDAIDNVKSRSKKTLTDEDVQKRREMRKIQSPSTSTVMRETKGWTIRKEMRQTEREEAENEKFLKSMPSAKRRMNPVPFVNHIPKLATPNWRNM